MFIAEMCCVGLEHPRIELPLHRERETEKAKRVHAFLRFGVGISGVKKVGRI